MSGADARDLTRISNYLNGISTMEGHFVQVGHDGELSEGTFYLRRPGRIRFEYRPPNPALVTGPVGPSWSLSVPLPPVPINTLFLFQGFALNTSLLPAWDAVVVTNPVILYVP